MLDSQTIANHLAAQRIREDIAQVDQEYAAITARFATYAQAPVEEQLAIRLAFVENRTKLGDLSQQLLRLVCSPRTGGVQCTGASEWLVASVR
jgi:hypothetical protein